MKKWIGSVAFLAVASTGWGQLPPIPEVEPLPPVSQIVERVVDYSGWYEIAAEAIGTTAWDLRGAEGSVLQESYAAEVHPFRVLFGIYITEYREIAALRRARILSRREASRLRRAMFLQVFDFLVQPPEVLATAAPRSRWGALGIEDYDVSIRVSCFCMGVPGFEGEVLGGELVSAERTLSEWVEDPDGGNRLEVVSSEPVAVEEHGFLTVEGMEAHVQEAIDGGAEVVHAAYDPVFGYISEAYIDWSRMIADEEIGYSVTIWPK